MGSWRAPRAAGELTSCWRRRERRSWAWRESRRSWARRGEAVSTTSARGLMQRAISVSTSEKSPMASAVSARRGRWTRRRLVVSRIWRERERVAWTSRRSAGSRTWPRAAWWTRARTSRAGARERPGFISRRRRASAGGRWGGGGAAGAGGGGAGAGGPGAAGGAGGAGGGYDAAEERRADAPALVVGLHVEVAEQSDVSHGL